MVSKNILRPFKFEPWIADYRHLPKPRVGNVQLCENADLMVAVVVRSSRRTDFHDNPMEEVFCQFKGDMGPRVTGEGKPPADVQVREGDIYMLPGHVRHARRNALTASAVEFARLQSELDAFGWYRMYGYRPVRCSDLQFVPIVDDLSMVLSTLYANEATPTCPHCGALHRGKDWLEELRPVPLPAERRAPPPVPRIERSPPLCLSEDLLGRIPDPARHGTAQRPCQEALDAHA